MPVRSLSASKRVVSDREPANYTTTILASAPDFDMTAVQCDDGGLVGIFAAPSPGPRSVTGYAG